MARTRSAMNMNAPRRTPTTVSGPGGRRASISAPQLGDPAGDGRGGDDFAGWHPPTVPESRRPVNRRPETAERAGARDWPGTWPASRLSLTMKMPMKTLTLKRIVVVGLALLVGLRRQDQERRARSARRPSSTSRWTPSRSRRSKGPTASTWRPSTSRSCSSTRARRWPRSATTTRSPRYEQLLREFPGNNKYQLPSLYNEGLAHQGKKDWAKAADVFKKMAELAPNSPDTKDALFQLGATYAEMGNWPTSATLFAQLMERKDMTADDKIEAFARRGFAQFQLKDLDTAERTFTSALYFFRSIEKEERLQTDFYLGLVKYHLGQIPHERFRALPLRLPEKQMAKDMDDKARLLLTAQRQYIETIKMGNPQWASASGYQVGSLYEEFYDSFVHAPIPPDLIGDGEPGEARGLLRGAAQEDPDPAREVAAHARAKPVDARAPGRAERMARQIEAGVRQAAKDVGPELQVRLRRSGNGRQPVAGPAAAADARPRRPAGRAARRARSRACATPSRPSGRPAAPSARFCSLADAADSGLYLGHYSS